MASNRVTLNLFSRAILGNDVAELGGEKPFPSSWALVERSRERGAGVCPVRLIRLFPALDLVAQLTGTFVIFGVECLFQLLAEFFHGHGGGGLLITSLPGRGIALRFFFATRLGGGFLATAFALAGLRLALALLGRHALPVFALGTILSFAVRAAKEIAGAPTLALDVLMISGGIAAMIGFAALFDLSRRAATVPARVG